MERQRPGYFFKKERVSGEEGWHVKGLVAVSLHPYTHVFNMCYCSHMNVYSAEARGRKRKTRGGRKGEGQEEKERERDEGKEEASERESRRAPCRSP